MTMKTMGIVILIAIIYSVLQILPSVSGKRIDKNMKILLNLDYSFKDVDWYLEKFKDLQKSSAKMIDSSTMNEVNEFAQEMGWNRIVSLLQEEGTFNESLKEEANLEGNQIIEVMKELYKEIAEKGIVIGRDEPAYKHSHAFIKTDQISTRNSRVGFIMEAATKFFMEKTNLPPSSSSGLKLLGDIKLCKKTYGDLLVAPFQKRLQMELDSVRRVCDPSTPYKSKDGTCNNLKEPMRGAGFRKFRRILQPDYHDGVSQLRRDVRGKPLPSARLVSTAMNRRVNSETKGLSSFHMTFGQFLDHDLTRTPIIMAEDDMDNSTRSDATVKCCDPKLHEIVPDPDVLGCAVISIPEDDAFYSKHGETCMEFIRSSPAPKCELGTREQSNEQSSYIDGSAIYGVKSYAQGEDPLREYKDGLLKVTDNGGLGLLPISEKEEDGCNKREKMAKGEFCFMSGDGRVNEVPILTFFHVVWSREHNRVAKILKSQLGPDASDETLYQEARRIVISELQHVTYNEYLPTLIPSSLLKKSGLLPKKGRRQTKIYDDNEDASIANSFATATFRFGHSEIRDIFKSVSEKGKKKERELSSVFFNPFIIYKADALGDMARGSCSLKAAKVDSSFSEEIAGKLFRGNGTFGLDLLAINIQRGRDHGLPGYTKWLAKCGRPKVKSFKNLKAVMDKKNIKALKKVYKDVNDIDLYAGGISEKPLKGGSLGFTFTCLLTEQFRRIKVGDRFWYEEKGQAGSFTPAQMNQIHRVSLARVFCNNVPELSEIQVAPLKYPGPDNPIESCTSKKSLIPDYHFKPWKTKS